jgi:opacity protein-like surface antigen
MVNKKYLLLAGLCLILGLSPSKAQESDSAASKWSGRDMTYRGENYDVLDSSYYRGKRLLQYRSYMSHQTAFSPMPNNMWEIGINGGLSNIFGDVTPFTAFSRNLAGHGGPSQALGYGFTIRKSLGYFLSVRFQYLNAKATGMDYRPHYLNERPWTEKSWTGQEYPNEPGGYYIYPNYRTAISESSIQLVGALNNIRFHKAKNKLSVYGFIGVGLMSFSPKINAWDKDGNPYQFRPDQALGIKGVPGYPEKSAPLNYTDRNKVYDALYQLLDDSWESNPRPSSFKASNGKDYAFVMTTGFGLQYRLNQRFTFQLEEKMSFSGNDLLDGTEKESNLSASNTANNDIFNYGSVGLNYNLGNKRKNVAPLWWINPLDHSFNEISDPRHMRLPDPVLPDNDGDGIPDQFDKCPGSPVGVPVDAHGCPLDTDGDGVPDFRDKEIITPTICQPVDADGIGKCPCPDGCEGKRVVDTMAHPHCSNITFGSLSFSGSKAEIAPTLRNQLANLAAQMKANPTCKVVIIGNGNETKKQQQRSWDRVNALINFMSDVHGIDRNRFIFQYAGSGDANTVMFRSANEGEDGPSNVAPPFPNLRQE